MLKVAVCWFCCCLLSTTVGAGQRDERVLTLCYEDQDSYPWVMTNNSGLNLELLALVEQALELRFRFVSVPWKRCLSGLENGVYDGAFASSYKAERLAMGRYPTDEHGRLDEGKRLHTSTYALYRRKGSPVSWNGKEFVRLDGRIGSLSGFSIGDFIRERGAEVDETSRDPLALLQMLKHGRIAAAALQSLRADFVLQANPQLAASIEKIELPLEEKAYYLMLSNTYVADNPTMAKAIWTAIEQWRQSALYEERVQKFLAQPLE